MQGRRAFTKSELVEIRRLLAEKQRASRSRQKTIRQAIRNKGFFISDFRSGVGGFGPRDLDGLVDTGQIQILDSGWSSTHAESPESASRVSIWERFLSWFKRLLSPESRPLHERSANSTELKRSHRTGALEPLLAPGLELVFVGTEPGPTSVRLGLYYANPDNTFYRDLHAAGFTSKELRPDRYRALLNEGIGLDDVYDDPDALRLRLLEAGPRAVCFNSKGALKRFANPDLDEWTGASAGRYVQLGGALIWAVPDSSPRASRYHYRRLRLLKQLHDRIRGDVGTGLR